MNSTDRRRTLAVLVSATLFLLFSSSVISFSEYSAGCKVCHGDFKGDPYVSKKDGSAWDMNLMDGHMEFIGSCDTCHKSGSRGEVFLNQSADSTLSMSCVGCHGRTEDVNGNCSSEPGGVEVHCGSGDGLRAHHEREVGAGTCTDCHANPSPVGEDVTPFNYGKSGISIQNSCDTDGTESRYGATGLDNDGDGQTDGADSDCQQANTPPTQPGTLSASAITVNSATINWGASTDAEGDAITYQVEYRRNGDAPWTSNGSTNSTNSSLTGLDSATFYDVRITPTDGMDPGPDRIEPNLFQTDALNTPPTRPGTVSASAITVNSATVSWDASTDAEGDTISYQVDYRKNGITNWTDGGSTNNTSQALSGLASATFYDVRVTPSDGKDTGTARTTSNVFQTNALNSPPTQPGALSASAITENSATVIWGASTDVDEDPITYQVEYRRNGDVPWTGNGSTSSTSSPLTGLDPATSYDVRITPTDGTDPGPDRTEPNLFQTFTLDEIIFKNSFE